MIGNRSATDVWSKLSAEIDPARIGWRQDGKATGTPGNWKARFVAYIDAYTVRERLDSAVPGEWDVTLEILETLPGAPVAIKARLQILGVIREDIGEGTSHKAAATDAFKRAAQQFGIGRELTQYKQNWVPVDGDGKFARPLKDPGEVYAAKTGAPVTGRKTLPEPIGDAPEHIPPAKGGAFATPGDEPVPTANAGDPDDPSCPKCGGRMWDNRLSKRNPKAPDFKCRNRSCDGVKWPAKAAKDGAAPAYTPPPKEVTDALDLEPVPDDDYDDEDLPF